MFKTYFMIYRGGVGVRENTFLWKDRTDSNAGRIATPTWTISTSSNKCYFMKSRYLSFKATCVCSSWMHYALWWRDQCGVALHVKHSSTRYTGTMQWTVECTIRRPRARLHSCIVGDAEKKRVNSTSAALLIHKTRVRNWERKCRTFRVWFDFPLLSLFLPYHTAMDYKKVKGFGALCIAFLSAFVGSVLVMGPMMPLMILAPQVYRRATDLVIGMWLALPVVSHSSESAVYHINWDE